MSNNQTYTIMSNILGKTAKTVTESWKLVNNSVKKLAKSQLAKTTIAVFKSKFDEDKLVARVTVGNQYVDFTVDMKCNIEAGDYIDPATVMVYKLTNGEKTITRLWGKVL